jgi:PTS system fructose-specific IIA component
MAELITPDLVDLNLENPDRHEATRSLASRLQAAGRVTDLEGFIADLAAREAQMPTGLEGGIGIPHARSEHVTEPTLGFGRSSNGIDWGAADGPARLIFLIAAPAGGGAEHMNILAQLARRLVREQFRQSLLNAPDEQTVVDIINKEVLGR